MLLIYLVTERIYHLIEVLRLPLFGCAERVAGRIVEHDNVVELHLAQSLRTVVAPLRPLYVRLAVEHRKRMLGERKEEQVDEIYSHESKDKSVYP